MSLQFAPSNPTGRTLKLWWQELEDHRGDRARLRRAASEVDALIEPITIELIQRLRPHTSGDRGWELRTAGLAGLSAHLDPHSPAQVLTSRSLAERMADRGRGDSPILSPLRFRRLLQRERSELYPAMIRVLRHLGGQVSLFDLADSYYYWGEKVRLRWALTYFPHVPHK